jgi:Tol biopolymer transport system component
VALALSLPSAGLAQFGKNKVQYQAFEFRVLETDHFHIYYYPEEEAAVMDAARMAERGYARLAKVFRHQWDEKKPLILYASQSDFQQTNIFRFQLDEGIQGVTEGLRNRIVLFFPSAYPDFDHTLTHELVHAFQYDIMRRGALSQGNHPFAFRPPLWFLEGMAEYLSTGEIDAQTAMWLRDASLSGYLTSLDELSAVGDIRVYRFGQAIWYYIGTKFGDEKIGEVMQKAPLVGVDEAFKDAIGLSLEELSDDWLEAVRLTYFPQALAFQPAERIAQRLTSHVRERSSINIAPAVSPDGRRVAFLSDRDYFNDLYVVDVDDPSDPDKLVKGERTTSFESLRFLRAGMAFSPDGHHLAFSSKAGEQDALYIMRVEDEEIVAVHRFGLEGIETPSWSPDGRQLVFTGLEGGMSDLFVVDRDGTGLKRLTHDPFGQRDPTWSPDGLRIAFTTELGPGTDIETLAYDDFQIGVLDLASGHISHLPDQLGRNINPQWGPDGRTLAYVSDRTGIANIFLYDFDRGTHHQLTDLLTGVSGVTETSPALSWSRDGGTMVFSAFADAGWDLYRLQDPLERVGEPYVNHDESEFDLDARVFVAANVEPSMSASSSKSDETKNAGEERSTEPQTTEVVEVVRRNPGSRTHYLGERRLPRTERPAVRVPSFVDPVDVPALLADPTIGLPQDTSTFEIRPYEVKFQPDIVAQPQVGFVTGLGAFGASQLAFSDLLGDHNLYVSASVYGSLTDSDLFFTYANLRRRLNWGASAFQFRSDFAPLSVGSAEDVSMLYRSDVYRGGQLFGAYPLSRFRRFEFGAVAAHVDRRVARFELFAATPEIEEDLPDQAFAAPSAAYVYDTAYFGSTGPVGGSRQRIEIQRAFGDQAFTQLYGDVRSYWLIHRHLTLASRVLFLGVYGQHADNLRSQSIGGPTLLRGYDYRDARLRGTEVGLLNVEVRFPINDRPRIGGALFPPLRGAFWFDLGYARCSVACAGLREESGSVDDGEGLPDGDFDFSSSDSDAPFGFRLADARASFGGGVRMNLFGFAVLRLDYAVPTDLASLGKGRVLFALAPEF